ncbi:MAG: spore germination protein [Oscillospiraceae bacterium]|nr:spore germination protein [Oscillospiraceae bacterium]
MQSIFTNDIETMEQNLRKRYCGMDDIKINRLHGWKTECLLVFCDGMIDLGKCWQILVRPVLRMLRSPWMNERRFMQALSKNKDASFDIARHTDATQMMHAVMSGAAVILAAGVPYAISIGLPGYSHRAVSDSFTEQNVRASREGFTEPIKINQTLIRRRLKSEQLVFENLCLGKISKTDIAVVYLRDRAQPQLVEAVKARLNSCELDTVLESGVLEPFLAKKESNLISGIGHTERPDVLCAKLREGKVAVLVDGMPFAILVPHLFFENFQNMDDYSGRGYYANFMRLLRLFAFFVSCFFPGIFVAMVNYNPELIPSTLLFNIAAGASNTPLPLMLEALFIHFVYELVREAGLRLPQPVGHSVSLIGALVVGDAAVNAGIVSSSMVMIIAFAAICSYTVPSLYEPIAVLRPIFILLGGIMGPLGVVMGLSLAALDVKDRLLS